MERELLSKVFMEGFREEVDNELSMSYSQLMQLGIRKTVWVGKVSNGMEERQVWRTGITNS